MTDLMIIIVLTLASCLAVGLIGLGLLHLVRYRSLRQQLTIATLLPVVAVATTVLINVQLMFLSAHDSLVILIALLVSATPGGSRRMAGGTADLPRLTSTRGRTPSAGVGLVERLAGCNCRDEGGRRTSRARASAGGSC